MATQTEVKFYWGNGVPSDPVVGGIYVDETNEMMYICIAENEMIALTKEV